MIRIGRNIVTDDTALSQYSQEGLKWKILNKMQKNDAVYAFSSLKMLDFELAARAEMVNAAERLNNSFFSFRLFKDAMCNPAYWDRTQEGGFRLNKQANPHEAIRDILRNSKLYGTECATAIVIVFYLCLVEVLPAGLFDKLFGNIYLMDWKYLDKDLGVHTYTGVKDSLPGDCLYIKNPDVNPDTPEWQGENVIQLLDGYYYGHGIGISSKERIIKELNRNRAHNSQTSAYLMDRIVKPDYRYLGTMYYQYQS